MSHKGQKTDCLAGTAINAFSSFVFQIAPHVFVCLFLLYFVNQAFIFN